MLKLIACLVAPQIAIHNNCEVMCWTGQNRREERM